jgi:hypothetical protein
MNVLQEQVLVLNRLWQAIDVVTAETAFCNIVRGVATGIDIGPDQMRPVTLQEWLALPIREQDRSIGTIHGLVRVPTVIACVRYDRMPKKHPKLNTQNVRKRDRDRCQYTNRLLGPNEGNLDHVVPRSRGGKDTWDNLVYCAKDINEQKADRLPEEAGLTLVRKPVVPKEVPAMMLIEPEKPDWTHFLLKHD